jgi:serine protease Do
MQPAFRRLSPPVALLVAGLFTATAISTRPLVAEPTAPPPEQTVHQWPTVVREAAGQPTSVNVENLRQIQTTVQKLLPDLLAATVGISQSAGGQGSGVIVSAEGLILTAGHVSGTPGRELMLHLSDGRTLRGKTLGRNKSDDSGMIQILEDGPFPHVALGTSTDLRRGDWIIALGHPGGWRRDRPAVLRVGRVSRQNQWVVSDAVLVGGDSGGPLFNLEGKLVGIHSRIGNSTASNMHVPIDKVSTVWDRLAAGEEWSSTRDGIAGILGITPGGPYLGIEVEEADDGTGVRVTLVEQSGPAAGAGVLTGDVISKINDRAVSNRERLVQLLGRYNAGDTVRLEVLRDDAEPQTLRVRLGRRPTGP